MTSDLEYRRRRQQSYVDGVPDMQKGSSCARLFFRTKNHCHFLSTLPDSSLKFREVKLALNPYPDCIVLTPLTQRRHQLYDQDCINKNISHGIGTSELTSLVLQCPHETCQIIQSWISIATAKLNYVQCPDSIRGYATSIKARYTRDTVRGGT